MAYASEAPIETQVHHISAFDFDDAFSDGDDNDVSYQFSTNAIREEIARSLPGVETSWMEATEEPEDLTAPNGFFEAQDTTVSSIDINGDSPDLHPGSSSLPCSPNGSEMSAHFSQISLSTSEQDIGPSHEHEQEHDDDHHTGIDIPYPNVLIDASKSPSSRVLTTSRHPEPHTIPPFQSDSSPSPPRSPSELELPMPQSSQSLPTARPTARPTPPVHSPQNAGSTSSLSPSTSAPLPLSTSTPTPPSLASSLPQSQSSQKPISHRPTRSAGPSILEKVRSKTRPSFLPPKSRKEDDKHMADWESMMKLSRVAADKRRKALQERRLAREKKIEESLHLWEKEIVPDWKIVHKNPVLRKLWWKGIPTKLRATMWERAVGNALALSKDNYRTCLARAKRALTSGTFPPATLTLIEQDISATLPALHIFHHETGPLYADLKDMLCAWLVSRSDEGLGYTMGVGKVAAMLLINMAVQQAFVVMRNLLERHCMRSFFGGEGAREEVEAYYRIFDTLVADGMPKIYFNFKQHQISPSAYLPDWILPLFLDHLPFEACARVWDVLLLEGDSFLYRAALGILAVLEPRLFFPDRRELLELLKGENKAALDVARREGRELNGGKYEIYGVDEETLWERIDNMEDWWKESTWTRLIQRELPDL